MVSRRQLAAQVDQMIALATHPLFPRRPMIMCGGDWVVSVVSPTEADINRQSLNETAELLREIAEARLKVHGFTLYGVRHELQARLSA